jgi:lysozyme
MNKVRIAVSGLSVSAALIVALAVGEGYVGEAMIPTKDDRPTVGFGSTFKADGTPVKMGDRTDPVRALMTMHAHLSREERAFRTSLPGVALTQGEYDLYMDFVYQYGTATWSSSSMRRQLLAGEYRAACDALLKYRFAAGFDCSTPGNKRCAGVWARQQERHAKCLAEQVAS